MPLISKSRYLDGLQCDKLLWHRFNAKQLFPPVDASTQAVFDQGHEVGGLAKTLFPGGIEITGKPWEYEKLLGLTQEKLGEGRPLFEAAFKFHNAFARTDILSPKSMLEKRKGTRHKTRKKRDTYTEDLFPPSKLHRTDPLPPRSTRWDLIEVKSSTAVKEVNISDLALQRYVVEGSGLTVDRCILVHINNQYVRRGSIDVEQLFHQVDVTDLVAEVLPSIEKRLGEMEKVIAKRKTPDVLIGVHCTDPYDCALIPVCWESVSANSPLSLYRFGKEEAFSLLHGGVATIAEVPATVTLNEKQDIQVSVERSGRPHVDRSALGEFLSRLSYPAYYLDFESFSSAIPLIDGSKPYQQVPFQFSLHIQPESGAGLRHISWLAEGGKDPRPEMLALLRRLLSDNGSIVAYNASFEKRILADAAEEYPEFSGWVDSLQDRFVDLLEPFRGFAYYHSAQHGSASMKAVLPALVGTSYEGMAISDGEQASREFMRVTFGDVKESERARVRKSLEEYCGQDTKGMVDIVESLKRLTSVE